MVRYQRYHPFKKGVEVVVVEADEESHGLAWGNANNSKRGRPRLLSLLFLSLLSCTLIMAPQLLNFPTNFLYSFGHEDESLVDRVDVSAPLCSSVPNGTICCDRSSIRTDICIMKGDVRTHFASSSLYLFSSKNIDGVIDYAPGNEVGEEEEEMQFEKIKPYTRKWETSVMDTIDELQLISKTKSPDSRPKCDVHHDVPAVFFSAGGYTGNLYHEFNDGIMPLYITSQHLNKRVVFVVLEYHNWWFTKYGDILSQLSDYPPLDFRGDNRTHCFPEAIVGLRIHDELTVDPSFMEDGKSIKDFRDLLDQAYSPRVRWINLEEEQDKEKLSLPSNSTSSSVEKRIKGEEMKKVKKPKLVILSRNGTRSITNEDSLVKIAEEVGFEVDVVMPQRTSELAKIYRSLNASDVMVGVHGAAMTHFMFLRPGSVFIQVIPLGVEWAAETYFGEPAMKLGLKYMRYKILPRESTLYELYDKNHPVLTDPANEAKKGWDFVKKTYLDHQDVRLNLGRFRKRLVRAYEYSLARKKNEQQLLRLQSQ